MKEVPASLPSESETLAGLRVARAQSVAVFVVAYNAEAHIRDTLERIPAELRPLLSSVYVIDDKSSDETTREAERLKDEIPGLEVYTTPFNQGYGGNQKLGYRYAIERGFDIVVLLHGDGQYAPEALPRMLAPFEDPVTSAVFGSRMMIPGASRKGGMPFYKRVGNRILSYIENKLLGSELSEFHSGYRAYRVAALASIPFSYNTNDFHFDTEIIIQLIGRKQRIVEVPIPTYYGDEICHVNGIAYAFHCLATILRSLANRVHLVYHPKFDLARDATQYRFKKAPTSLHQFVLGQKLPRNLQILELGAGSGDVGLALYKRGGKVCAVDLKRPDRSFPYLYIEQDLNEAFAEPVLRQMGRSAGIVVALDVLEHLNEPEKSIRELRETLSPGGILLASTGNVAYAPLRLGLLLGQFNYGKKGILDLTHRRLFTIRSFCRTLEGEGFEIRKVRGFGPPIQDMVGDSLVWRILDRCSGFLAWIWPSLFSYQFIVEAVRLDDIDDILARTVRDERVSGRASESETPRRRAGG